MSVNSAWDLAAIFDHTVGTTSGVVISQVTEYPLESGVQLGRKPSSGQVYPRCAYMMESRPAASVQCEDLATVIGQWGLAGYLISADVDEFGLYLYGQQHAYAGMRNAGSVHQSYLITSGMIVPRRLTADADGAQVFYDIIAAYPAGGGSSDPVTVNASVALPTYPATESYWALGKVSIAGTTFNNVDRVSVDFGINLRVERNQTDIFPSWVSIGSMEPVITIEGSDPTWWTTSGVTTLAGTAVTHANTKIQLRKRACGGRFTADGTTEHISITTAGLAYPERTLSGSPRLGAGVRIESIYDGTNAPVIVNTGVAYVP